MAGINKPVPGFSKNSYHPEVSGRMGGLNATFKQNAGLSIDEIARSAQKNGSVLASKVSNPSPAMGDTSGDSWEPRKKNATG